MTPTYSQLLDHVGVVRRSWRIRRATEGALLTLAIGVVVLLVLVLCDRWGRFGHAGRGVMALLFWGGLAAAGWYCVLRRRRAGHSQDFFAALIERALPVSGGRFISALQLGRDGAPDSPRLVEAIVHEGATVADELDPAQAVAGPMLRHRALTAGAAVLLAVIYGLAAGPAAVTSLARVLLPGADIAPFTWTRVAITPGQDVRVLEGTAFTVTVRTSGRTPRHVNLECETAGETRAVRMTAGEGGAYTHTFPALTSGMRLRAHVGDAYSAPVQVTVDSRPRIENLRVTYRAPAYAGRKPDVRDAFDGHLRGLAQTVATLEFTANKPLEALRLTLDGADRIETRAADGPQAWVADLTLTRSGSYRVDLADTQGYEVEDPTVYTITLDRDQAPSVAFAQPAVDLERRPEETVDFAIVARDDLGLAEVAMRGVINDSREPLEIERWVYDKGDPRTRTDVDLARRVDALGLKPGDRLQYWAEALDRNNVAPEGPGRAVTRRYTLLALTADQAAQALDAQLSDYAKAVEELIRLQRLNRVDTAGFRAAAGLIDRQSMIRRLTLRLAERMEQNAFPARTLVGELRELAADPMARVTLLLESYRDTADRDAARAFATRSLPLQDEIVSALEDILSRLDRAANVRKKLKALKRQTPEDHAKVLETLDRMAADLEKFLGDVRELETQYERLAKRDADDITEDFDGLDDVEHRMDEWKQWFKDSVDAITKLPQGFVADSYLADNLRAILEEVEIKPRKPTVEIATPIEEGVKALGTEMMEDFEMWMPDRGDSIRWVMEDPIEGIFDVPEMLLSSDLQDMVGELIEDLDDFDEAADDVTGAWGGNIQMGWDIADGPISSFNATGKTGNQLPNASEMSGRSGDGRRGRSSGQMVGDTSRGLEGRPTPARVTNEPYQDGVPKAKKQLDPRGSTGGGRKTGGGHRGLQGGTPPDMVKDMDRLESHHTILRERAQQVVRRLPSGGRPATHVARSIRLLTSAEGDYRDRRYDDAARKRKLAIGELRAAQSRIGQAVALSLSKATALPAEMREAIGAGAQQALPEGYEEIVGAYYQTLSRAGAVEAE